MATREDKLKNLLSGKGVEVSGPQEVKLSNAISPVARIKVV